MRSHHRDTADLALLHEHTDQPSDHPADSSGYQARDAHTSAGPTSTRSSIVVAALTEAEDRLSALPRTEAARRLRRRLFALQRAAIDALAAAPLSELDSVRLVSDVVALAADVLVLGRLLDEGANDLDGEAA
jgi:hypothetical protein